MHKCFILFYFLHPESTFFLYWGQHRISDFWQGFYRYNSEDRFSLLLVAIRFQDMDVMALTAVAHENVFMQGISVVF
jgi:hypothetical protein